jgi:DNA topoisomerase IA
MLPPSGLPPMKTVKEKPLPGSGRGSGIEPENTRRIVFNEITREAILHANEHPRTLDQNLVNAQQARRILGRWWALNLPGFVEKSETTRFRQAGSNR